MVVVFVVVVVILPPLFCWQLRERFSHSLNCAKNWWSSLLDDDFDGCMSVHISGKQCRYTIGGFSLFTFRENVNENWIELFEFDDGSNLTPFLSHLF